MALTLGDNFSYQGAKPLDARLKYDTLAAMKAVADATMYDGCMAYCVATDKTYQWKSTNTVDEDTGKWREFSSGSGDTIQVDTLPTAGADELGNVYQYIGSTTLTLTHGYFYECVSDGAGTPTYSWEEVSTSKGGHDIKNNGVAVTERGVMNFTDFDISDDSTNEETDIKAHRLTTSELMDICSPLPSVPSDMPVLFDETGAEYVVGWYKLSNGTKKPVYRRTFSFTAAANCSQTQQQSINIPANTVEKVFFLSAMYKASGTNNIWNMVAVDDGSGYGCIGYRDDTGALWYRSTFSNINSQPIVGYILYSKSGDTPV